MELLTIYYKIEYIDYIIKNIYFNTLFITIITLFILFIHLFNILHPYYYGARCSYEVKCRFMVQ